MNGPVITTLADARALEAQARRAETECGPGVMVWRIWGAGEPVVLLHGGSGNWSHWVRNIAPLVAAGRAVFVPDMPGCGESDPPPDGFDGDVLPQWIEKGVRALIGQRPFDLVGFSFGAMVAGLYAAAYPALVRRLVLVGAPALTNNRAPKVGLREWTRLPDGAERNAAWRHNLRALMLARDESVDDLSYGLYVESIRRDRLTKRRLAGTDILLRTLPQIECPLWGVWGAQDVLYRDRFDILAPALGHAPRLQSVTEIPHAGHWVQFEEAEAFNALLQSCLDA